MDNTILSQNTQAWRFQVWVAFGLSFGLTLFGLYYAELDIWTKGYLGMGIIFTVGSCFSLAKTLRDDHEYEKIINRVSAAKTEQILADFEGKT